MSKSEEFAYSKYPKDRKGVLYDLARNSIIQGYNQAEKDLELTWEDIERIDDISIRLDGTEESKEMSNKEFYQEVLKRFKKIRMTNYGSNKVSV